MRYPVLSVRLTPETVSKTDDIYTIPIYQRLFEWDEPRIEQLLQDLSNAYSKKTNPYYYVGMLTSNDKNEVVDGQPQIKHELVDGQQRFTVMMLLGIVLSEYYEPWNSFLQNKQKKMRLAFTSRKMDNTYLANFCKPSSFYENIYMKKGIACVKKFIEKNYESNKREKFSQYVFTRLSFFISNLPEDYHAKDLNKYFETMNSTGKNLENHEILKVKMLQNAGKYNKGVHFKKSDSLLLILVYHSQIVV